MDSFHKSSEIENMIEMCGRFSRNASRAGATTFLNSIRCLFDVESACLAQFKTDPLQPMAGFVSVGSDLKTIKRELSVSRGVQNIAKQISVATSGKALFSILGVQEKRATAFMLHSPKQPFDYASRTRITLIHSLIQPTLTHNATILSPITTGSRRVEQVCQGLLNGLSDKQIASDLGISPHTVHVYIKQLFKLRDVNSRAELLSGRLKEMSLLNDRSRMPLVASMAKQ